MKNEGFFSLKQNKELTTVSKNTKARGCYTCKLYKDCISPKLFATGKGKKKILIIGEAQGEKEDKRKKQFVGKAGKRVRRTLKKFNIDLDRDCRKINSVCCRPPRNRNPKTIEIDSCRPNILNEIEKNPPKLIIAFGSYALESLFGHRIKNIGGITKWRGWCIPDRDFKCWICPTYHPSYIDRNEHNPATNLLFEKDIENALFALDKPIPEYNEDNIKIFTDHKSTNKRLRYILKKKPKIITFDYETTGLKPHRKGHSIVSCSISWENYNIAFLINKRVMPLLKQILTDPDIKKTGHNIKFEHNWTREVFDVTVRGWIWDSMLAAHCLDNRRKITRLKFQSLVRYGVLDYDSHIEPFLKSKKKGANEFNRIEELNQKDLLLYCGMDSLLEYRLAMDQMKEIGIIDPYKFADQGHGNIEL